MNGKRVYRMADDGIEFSQIRHNSVFIPHILFKKHAVFRQTFHGQTSVFFCSLGGKNQGALRVRNKVEHEVVVQILAEKHIEFRDRKAFRQELSGKSLIVAHGKEVRHVKRGCFTQNANQTFQFFHNSAEIFGFFAEFQFVREHGNDGFEFFRTGADNVRMHRLF